MGRRSLHFAVCAAAAAALLLHGCSDEPKAPQVEADPLLPSVALTGVWAGTFTGATTYAGTTTGNWEVDVIQGVSGLEGSFTMSGDADCLDGSVSGALDWDHVLRGQIFRSPCADNFFTLTALDPLRRTTAGVWNQPAYGSVGTFTGTQVARPGGPLIRFLAPLAAPPGSLVTVAGTGFDPIAERNAVDFGGIPAAAPVHASATALVVRVPTAAAGGQVAVTTPVGTALSPRRFDVNPAHPATRRSVTLDLHATIPTPRAIAIDGEGRKAYAVDGGGGGAVMVLDTARNGVLASKALMMGGAAPTQGIAVSPDFRRLYVLRSGAGVEVLQSALADEIELLPVPGAGGAGAQVPGIAVTPDGRTLVVAEQADGGSFRFYDLAERAEFAAVSRGAASRPTGLAVAPGGRQVFLLFAGANPGVDLFDLDVLAVTGTFSGISEPLAAAVTPDGSRLYVADAAASTVLRWTLPSSSPTSIPVGTRPSALALSPDGLRLWVVDRTSRDVRIVDTEVDAVVETLANPTSEPGEIVMSPDGKRAYLSLPDEGGVAEFGGPGTVTVEKLGTGLGTVTSSPAGIACGSLCQARFEDGTGVALTAAVAESNYGGYSRFDGWGGDCASDGTVTATGSVRCTATFTYVPPADSGGGGLGSPMTGGYQWTSCAVATAAFGGPWEPEVEALRAFRDERLLSNGPGRAFVRSYYAHSPPVARFLGEHEAARRAVRWLLTPVVIAVLHPLPTLAFALGAAALSAGAIRWRRRLVVRRGAP